MDTVKPIDQEKWARAKLALCILRDGEALIRELEHAGAVFTGNTAHIHCHEHNDTVGSLGIFSELDGLIRFRCHGCGATGTVLDLVAQRFGINMSMAVVKMVSIYGNRSRKRRFVKPRTKKRRDTTREEAHAAAYQRILRSSQELQQYLWCRRGISIYTAKQWGVGGRPEEKSRGEITAASWFIPVAREDGKFVGLKVHRDPPLNGKPKGGWLVGGGTTLFPPPEGQKGKSNEIILVPGELKALAYIDAGMAATSPTTGEGMRWNDEQIARLRGWRVTIDADRDDSQASKSFVNNAVEALRRVVRSLEVTV
jgi:hypothetical protein